VVLVALIAGNYGGPGTVTVTVLVLVLTDTVVVVLVLVLVVGEVVVVVVDPVVVLVVVGEVVELVELGEVVEVMVVVSVVDDRELGVVVLVVAAVRDVVVSGVSGLLLPVLEPPKIKKTINASRNAPRAPYPTSAHGLRYHGTGGSPCGCWP
jgi:hypothetical protein